MRRHELKHPIDCDCAADETRCPVCDWGLAVCKHCGMAEVELDDHPECPGSREAAKAVLDEASSGC